jgi:hypothetical protein
VKSGRTLDSFPYRDTGFARGSTAFVADPAYFRVFLAHGDRRVSGAAIEVDAVACLETGRCVKFGIAPVSK